MQLTKTHGGAHTRSERFASLRASVCAANALILSGAMRCRLVFAFAACVLVHGCAGRALTAASAPSGRRPGALGARAPSETPARDCILVDTDAGLDDLRALAALLPTGRVAGVVVTEGVATPARGASVMAYLIALASPSPPVPVAAGASSPSPVREPWLEAERYTAESMNHFFATALNFAPARIPLDEQVARWIDGCREVRVALLGPWSSYVRYRPRLARALRVVVAPGASPAELPEDARSFFNCRYDIEACRRAEPGTLWVALPRAIPPTYVPTEGMFRSLDDAGAAGVLRTAFLGNPGGWQSRDLRDDAVALYLLHPEAFIRRGAQVEPGVPPERLRALWLEAVSAAR